MPLIGTPVRVPVVMCVMLELGRWRQENVVTMHWLPDVDNNYCSFYAKADRYFCCSCTFYRRSLSSTRAMPRQVVVARNYYVSCRRKRGHRQTVLRSPKIDR